MVHVGTANNETADRLAKKGTVQEEVDIHVTMSAQSIKQGKAIKYVVCGRKME